MDDLSIDFVNTITQLPLGDCFTMVRKPGNQHAWAWLWTQQCAVLLMLDGRSHVS